MANRLVLAALGLFYAVTAVLLVRSLGETYRRSLREQRAILALASARKANAQNRQRDPLALVAKPDHEPPGHPLPSPVEPNDPKPGTPAAQPVLPARSLAHARISPGSEPKPYESPIVLRPLVLAGLDQASTAEEVLFGDTLNKLILINHPAVEKGSSQQKVLLEATQPMIDLRERKDVEVKLVVLDTDDVNAFSHLGGYLYVTRGLLSFAGTDEEFQFVVGHELAHIDLRHGQEQVAALTRDGTIEKLGTLQAMYHQVAAGYTEAQEFAADDRVIDRMIKLDHTPRECLMYLRKLRRLSEDLKFREGHQSPRTPPDATIQDVGNHIRSQPAAWKRVKRLESRLNVTPARPVADDPPASGR